MIATTSTYLSQTVRYAVQLKGLCGRVWKYCSTLVLKYGLSDDASRSALRARGYSSWTRPPDRLYLTSPNT